MTQETNRSGGQNDSAPKVAVITGAGTGVGQASAIKLAQLGMAVVLVGRTSKTLLETEQQLPPGSERLVYPCDIAQPEAVAELARTVERKFGRVDLLVNAAGLNVPDRSLDKLSLEDYRLIMGVNLDGAFYVAQSFLPVMRRQRSGTLVFIGSIAGIKGSVLAGPAYVSSKFGIHGLVQSINLAEQANGIRAIGIHPGEINTPIIDRRPVVPSPEDRAKMLQGVDMAECVAFVATLPPRVVIETLIVTPFGAPVGM
jgi:NAD(P)-dependent dehydrogenase (short-subunit alcohol dehydrogenase family)